jgi:hypothetical protein
VSAATEQDVSKSIDARNSRDTRTMYLGDINNSKSGEPATRATFFMKLH